MLNEHVALQGKFKFAVYKSDGTLRYTTESAPNFITSTGLCYPSNFAFADCFRFISLGTGNAVNSIQPSVNAGWGTTGLNKPTQYIYIGSSMGGMSQYEENSCGYRELDNQVSLTRAWRVPAGTGLFDKDYSFQEFMVTPGRPFVVDVDNSKACSNMQYTSANGLIGLDEAKNATSLYTNPSICAADKAFARIVTGILASQSDFMVVTYDLNLYFNSGTQPISVSIDNHRTTNWSGTLNGRANMVQHGIKLVYDGVATSSRYQIVSNEYGESFVPEWGAPMEPSCPPANLVGYLSTDNIQFIVNDKDGGPCPNSGVSGSGVMRWHSTPSSEGIPDRLSNPRSNGSHSFYPSGADFSLATSADTMGFTVDSVTQSRVSHFPMISPLIKNSRSRTGIYSFEYWGYIETDHWNMPVRSMVLGYYDQNDTTKYIPFCDIIFSDVHGNYPPIDEGARTYGLPSETSSPPTGYFYIENGGKLTMAFNMTWSSPCSSLVDGCP